MFTIRSPVKTGHSQTAPRKKSKARFIYNAENCQNMGEIVLSIANGLGIENVDPVLFPKLLGPLYYELDILVRDNNTSAQKEVKNAIDFIQKVQSTRKNSAQSTQQRINEIIYSDFAVKKLANAALNQQTIPALPPKLKDLVAKELENIANTTSEEFIQKKAEVAIYALTQQRKVFDKKRFEIQRVNINENKTVEQEEMINSITRRLEKDLQRLEIEKESELKKLRENYEAQMNLLQKNKFEDPYPEKTCDTDLIRTYKQQEQYYVSLRRYKQAENIRKQMKTASKMQLLETQAKWQNDREMQKKAIEDTYEEKYKIKVMYYKSRAIKMKKEAAAQINNIKKPQIKVSRPKSNRLPALKMSKKGF